MSGIEVILEQENCSEESRIQEINEMISVLEEAKKNPAIDLILASGDPSQAPGDVYFNVVASQDSIAEAFITMKEAIQTEKPIRDLVLRKLIQNMGDECQCPKCTAARSAAGDSKIVSLH